MSARRADLLTIALLIALSCFLFADVLFLGSNFVFRDLFVYHFPMKHAVREIVSRGELPLWNPFMGGGQPMAANPAYEIFYPPQLLIFVGSFPFGFALHILFHVWLALAGMYAFLRALPLGRAAAVFGALSFGLGGFFLGAATNLPTFFVWSWAGLAGWAVLRWLRGGSFGVAAIVVAMPMFVGEPIALLQFWGLLFLLGWREWRRMLLLAIAATCIAAVQLLPAVDLARDSVRVRGFDYEHVVSFSLPAVRPLELIAPHAFGVIDAEHPRWDPHWFAPRGTPYLLSIYCGLAVVALAAAGFARRLRYAGRVAAICAVSYLVALGGHTPLFRWLYAAGLRSLRYPEKFIMCGLVALVVFAAMVADRLDAPVARAAAVAAACAALIAATGGWWSACAIAAAWGVLFWFHRPSRQWSLAALALLLVDVGSFARQPIPTMPRRFFTPPPAALVLQRDRGDYNVFPKGEWQVTPAAAKLDAMSPSASPEWFARNGLRFYSAVAWGFHTVLEPDVDLTELLPTHDILDAMNRLGSSGNPNWGEPFALLSNVRYVVEFRSDATVDRPVRISRRANQGRYWFARELNGPLIRPGDAIVKKAFAPAPGRISGMTESSNGAALDVETAGTAFLVITITRHKYWHASIDGREAPLVAANIAYQGLVVPSGRHRIELRYRNPLMAWSGVVSALALVAVVTVPRRRRRRPRSGS